MHPPDAQRWPALAQCLPAYRDWDRSSVLHWGRRPLKIIYPYPAGGSGDAIARMFAEQLQKRLGRPVIVENKTGAGGRVGVQAAKEAAADGNTLLYTATGQLAIQPHVALNVGYDPFTDFIQIAEVAQTEVALAVSGQLPVQSLADLRAWLAANPDLAVYASPGTGTSAHFAGMEFAKFTGKPVKHVAYRGAPAALPDVIAGRVPILLAISAEMLEHHKSGAIRILAVGGSVRTPFLPDVPTFAQGGIDVLAPTGFSFHARRGIPPAMADLFEQAILAAARLPEMQGKISALGMQPSTASASELTASLRAQSDRWAALIKTSGFTPQ